MSINIFQFLKQGTSLNRKSLEKNKELEEKVVHVPRKENSLYFETGKFKESDDEAEDKIQGNEWEGLDEEALKHKHNQEVQKCHELRKKYKIKVSGTDVPFAINNFGALINKYKIHPKLAENLAKKGFEKPTPVQMQTIPAILEERNVLVTAPTGTGKTIAYLLPIIQKILESREKQSQIQPSKKEKKVKKSQKTPERSFDSLEALIISPQHELSVQIVSEISSLVSNISEQSQKITFSEISQLTSAQKQSIKEGKDFGINVLVSSPQSFLNIFTSLSYYNKLKYIVLDECDKYFEESFLEQIRNLFELLGTLKSHPLYTLFSATINPKVSELLTSETLDSPLRICVGGTNKTINNVEQRIEYCMNEYGKVIEIKNMISEGRFIPPVLIFVQEKTRVKQLLFELKKILKNGPGGIDISKKVDALSGEKSKEERQEIIDKFEKGNLWVLITTDVIARGIDFSHVNLVINYDFPNTILTYIHRIGRTGRAEKKGQAVTFFTDEDKPVVRSLANLLSVSGCPVPDWILALPNPDRKLKKKLEKYPVKRLPVGVASAKDKNFDEELEKMEKVWQRKKERAIKKEDEEKAERGELEPEESEEWIQA